MLSDRQVLLGGTDSRLTFIKYHPSSWTPKVLYKLY